MSHDDAQFDALLEHLHRRRGFDFGGYKRSSLTRRINRRMQTLGIAGYAAYRDHLAAHPEEFALLFDTILINVTGFFRDPAAWEFLGQEIVPRLVASKGDGEPIRVWSAGCASGEEACSLAIALAERLGIDQVRQRVKIYATDVDEEALGKARQASYSARAVQALAPPRLETYFEGAANRYVLHRELRRALIFGRHDLIQDAPISRIDLLVCRNTLMYFKTEAQAKILARFHFALNEGGFLFLGKAETLMSYGALFAPASMKRRIFVKVPKGVRRDRVVGIAAGALEGMFDRLKGHARVREAAFDAAPVAQLVVAASGLLDLANERACALFGLAAADLGRPIQDLPIAGPPADLRAVIERAYAARRPVASDGIEWRGAGGETRHLDVRALPLFDLSGTLLGATVAFLDVTELRAIEEELEQSTRALAAANEALRTANEELETTNEELQSTVEELEATNEELQAANEELETTNEELQSTNQELETINEELRLRGAALDEGNACLAAILDAVRGGMAVVGRDLRVRVWNAGAEELWGPRAGAVVDRDLFSLDIGLPLAPLRAALGDCLDGTAARRELVLDAVNRRGRAFPCRVTCSPLSDGQGERGALLLMEPATDPE